MSTHARSVFAIDCAGMRIIHPSGSRQKPPGWPCQPLSPRRAARGSHEPQTRTRYLAPSKQFRICGSSTEMDPAWCRLGARAHRQTRQLDVVESGNGRLINFHGFSRVGKSSTAAAQLNQTAAPDRTAPDHASRNSRRERSCSRAPSSRGSGCAVRPSSHRSVWR